MPNVTPTHPVTATECSPQLPVAADFEVNYGLIPTITVRSPACRCWLDTNAEIEAWQWLRDDLVAIEPAYLPMLIDAMTDAGLIEAEG